jgi:hypothetical protein
LDLYSFSPFTKPTTGMDLGNPELIKLLVERILFLDFYATEDLESNTESSEGYYDDKHFIKKKAS